jgi:hypothetical protein
VVDLERQLVETGAEPFISILMWPEKLQLQFH